MPRRRKVKARGTSDDRPRLQLPDGDEGNLLTPDERRTKLDIFLKDYDQEVESRVKSMEDNLESMLDAISIQCQCGMLRYPKDILHMPLSEFLAAGGTVDLVRIKQQEELRSSIVTGPLLQSMRKPLGSRTNLPMETIAEMEDKKAKRGRRRKAISVAPATRTRMSLRNRGRSRRIASKRPSTQMPGQPLSYPTPLHTPAFNPRLPNTPATVIKRRAKPGEALCFNVTSMAGSPVSVNKTFDDNDFNLPIGNNKVLSVPVNRILQEDESQVGQLTQSTREQLQALQHNLASILSLPPTSETVQV